MRLMEFCQVVLRNLVNKPVTKMYPVEKRAYFERTRGHIEIAIDQCIFCSICAKKCPTHAIGVDKGAKSWEIERMKCIQCNCCVEQCPKKCLKMDKDYTMPDVKGKKDQYYA